MYVVFQFKKFNWILAFLFDFGPYGVADQPGNGWWVSVIFMLGCSSTMAWKCIHTPFLNLWSPWFYVGLPLSAHWFGYSVFDDIPEAELDDFEKKLFSDIKFVDHPGPKIPDRYFPQFWSWRAHDAEMSSLSRIGGNRIAALNTRPPQSLLVPCPVAAASWVHARGIGKPSWIQENWTI